MKIRLITISHKPPAWIKEGYAEYAKRLPPSCALELIEIPAEKRTVNADLKMQTAIKPGHHVIALDVKGKQWTTEQLAEQLKSWLESGQHIDLLIGGPEGLTPACLAKAREHWSLSALTFPHQLVRILIAEQIYRAWSLLNQHPYHR